MFPRYRKDARVLFIIMNKMMRKEEISIDYVKSHSLEFKLDGLVRAVNGLQESGSYSEECKKLANNIFVEFYNLTTTIQEDFDIKYHFDKELLERFVNKTASVTDLQEFMLVLQKALACVFNENAIMDYKRTMKIVEDCDSLRNTLWSYMKAIKKVYCDTYPFYGKETPFNFEDGVLARSVQNLKIEQGFYGVNYDMISASVLNVECPNWYRKDIDRQVMLLYSIPDVDSLIGMFKTDGNTSLMSAEERDSITIALEQLLYHDGLEEECLNFPACDFSLGYGIKELVQSQGFSEVLLTACVKPRGILVAGNKKSYLTAEQYLLNDENYAMVKSFSLYYNLPVYSLEESIQGYWVKERRSFQDKMCFHREIE